jgi:hypothetical protein
MELSIITNTLHNNKCSINQVTKHPNPREQNVNVQHRKTQWATFTYSGKGTRKIRKLFNETKIALQTPNTTQNIVNPHLRTYKYEKVAFRK